MKRVPVVIKNKVQELLPEFDTNVKYTKEGSKANIQLFDECNGEERIHTIYINGDDICYRGMNIETGHTTEVDMENEEVKFLMYATLIMRLSITYAEIIQVINIIESNGLEVFGVKTS